MEGAKEGEDRQIQALGAAADGERAVVANAAQESKLEIPECPLKGAVGTVALGQGAPAAELAQHEQDEAEERRDAGQGGEDDEGDFRGTHGGQSTSAGPSWG